MPYIQFFGVTGPLVCVGDKKIVADNFGASDAFGASVAISSDGAYAVIVAPDEDTAASSAGSLYAFIRTRCNWAQQQMMQASDAAANDFLAGLSFGSVAFPAFTIAISDDGTRAIAGSARHASSDGAAYIFLRSGTTWVEEQKLAGAVGAGDNFGHACAMNAAGDYVAVAAPRAAAAGGGDAGKVDVYTRSGSVWTLQASVSLTTGGGAVDSLGYGLALSGDGATLAASRLVGVTSGKVEVFVRSGSTWSHQSSITAAVGDTTGAVEFGCSLALSDNGDTLVIGSPRHTTSLGSTRGAAYVFTRSGGSWTQIVKLFDTAGTADDYYGNSVSVSGDGATVLIGAVKADAVAGLSGAAFVYTGIGTWALNKSLLGSDTAGNDAFGRSVALSRDGNWAIVGANAKVVSGAPSAGATYVFHLPSI